MEKYGFVYIWYDRKHKRYYVGSHWGTEDDGYVCSSPWMMQAYKKRPQDFKRRILSNGIVDRSDLRELEYNWMSLIKESEISPNAEKPRYYNLRTQAWTLWHDNPDSRLSIGQKISRANKGRVGTFLGKTHSEATRKKLSESHKGYVVSEETKRKISESTRGVKNKNYGVPLSDEQKEKLRASHLGKKQSPETCAKRSASMMGKRHSEEAKAKMSAAARGRVFSEEHKRKLSESKKKMYHEVS